MKNYYLYILRCSDDSFYTGITNDIERRLKDHDCGKGSKYVFSRRPASLVYKKRFVNRSEASKEESKIKKLDRAQKIKLIEG
jgi:putative endonuclease